MHRISNMLVSVTYSSVYLAAVHCTHTVPGPLDKTQWDAHRPCWLAGDGRDTDHTKDKSSGAGAQRVRGPHACLEVGSWGICAGKGPFVLTWAARVLKPGGTEKIGVAPA